MTERIQEFPHQKMEEVLQNNIVSPGEEVPVFSVRETNTTNMVAREEVKTNTEPVIQPLQQPVKEQPKVEEKDFIQEATNEETKKYGSEVSDTVANLLEDLDVEEKAQEDKGMVDDILSRITVDLSSIDISNDSVDNINTVMSMMENKPVMQVINCQSAYAAYMTALNNSELRSLDDSEVDSITYRKRLAKLLHKHMNDTSIGKFDFPTFERITSYFDLETLIYGVYCKTYPYDNKYTIPRCPGKDCGQEYQTIINNNTLVETRKKNEVFDRINDILQSVKNPNDVVKASLLSKTKRVIVPEKKIIFDIRIPSIYNYLEETMVHIDKTMADENPAAVGTSIFVKTMYVPDLLKYQKEGKLSYIPVNDRKLIINTLINLSLKDSTELTNAIDEIGEKYKVTYSLKDVTCPHCGHVIPEIPLSMEEMLFLTFRLQLMGRN